MVERVEQLKRMLLDSTHFRYRQDPFPGSVFIDAGVSDYPLRIRKALAFKQALETMPIYIQENELIISGRTIFNLPFYHTDNEIQRARFSNNNIKDPVFNNVYNESIDEVGYKVADTNPARYKKILKQGLDWYVEFAKDRQLKKDLSEDQKEYYRSVEITVSAAQDFINRYADLIDEKLRDVTLSIERKAELGWMKQSIKRIQHKPPSGFYEAVQLVYFIWIMLWVEAVTLVPFDRLDQLLYPFYEKDISIGNITREKALEIIECFFIKINFDVDRPNNRFEWLKGDTGQTITLGGSLPEDPELSGENEVTFICLDALKELGLIDPHVHVRVNPVSSKKLWDELIDLVSYGRGIPVIDFDQNIEKALAKTGIYSDYDIADYCGTGCWELISGGRTSYRQCGNLDLLLPLEWILYSESMKELRPESSHFLIDSTYRGIPVENLDAITDFEDLLQLYFKELQYFIQVIVLNVIRTDYSFTPFLSAFVDDCLAKGKEIKEGGARYKETDIQASSLANITDSLYSIKKLVFEEKEYTLSEFAAILKNNYSENEALRQKIVNRIAKFGNENDEVDQLARETAAFFSHEVSRYTNGWGGPFRARIAGASSYVDNMNIRRASPDGRKAGDYTSQNASPQLGAEKNGPTALLNSITSIDSSLFPGGFILDLKFSADLFRTRDGREKVGYMLKAFSEKGGMQLQINVANAEVLKEAQRKPEMHKDLIVRVWGFSAYFIDLPKEFQDHVIRRTEFSV
jgi:pyruvate-formate lyase